MALREAGQGLASQPIDRLFDPFSAIRIAMSAKITGHLSLAAMIGISTAVCHSSDCDRPNLAAVVSPHVRIRLGTSLILIFDAS